MNGVPLTVPLLLELTETTSSLRETSYGETTRQLLLRLEKTLSRNLKWILKNYSSGLTSFSEALEASKKAVAKTDRQIIAVAANKLHIPVSSGSQMNAYVQSYLGSQRSKRQGDFTQILTDTGTHSEPVTDGYWSSDPALDRRVDMLAHQNVWQDNNDILVYMTMLYYQQERGVDIGVSTAAKPTTQPKEITFVWQTHPEESRAGPCEICDSLDDQEFSFDQINSLPFSAGDVHPSCYCTLEIRGMG